MNAQDLATKLWPMAQCRPDEGIEDAINRMERLIEEEFEPLHSTIRDLLEVIHIADTSCESLHHEKRFQHTFKQECPLNNFVNSTIEKAEAALRDSEDKEK